MLIFDFDGTIADTEDWHWFSWNDALEDYGVFLDDEKIKKYISNNDFQIIKMIEEDFNVKINVDTFFEKRLSIFVNKYLSQVKPYDYFLKIKEEYCIVSNQKKEIIEKFFKINNLGTPKIFSALNLNISKELLLERIIKENKEVTVYEDCNKYIKIAKKIGVKTVGIVHKHNKSTLLDADIIIEPFVI